MALNGRVLGLLATFVPIGFLALGAEGVTVYATGFELAPIDSQWSGAGSIQSTAGLSAFGLGSHHLRNDGDSPTILSLTALEPHTTLTLAFDLAIWDSADYHDINLDNFRVSADGGVLYDGPIANYAGNPINTYGNSVGPGIAITPDFTAYYAPNYGYGTFRDSARRVTFTLPHSTPSVSVAWQYTNSQGGLDESFGLDNVTIGLKYDFQPVGDANRNGRVDRDDYALIDRGFACGLTGWASGDFNSDGAVDAADYLLIDQAAAQTQGFDPALLSLRRARFGDGYVAQLLASVPEPAIAAVLAPVLCYRRGRRRI